MKRILLITLGLFLVVGVNAQARWGLKIGGNVSEMATTLGNNYLNVSKSRFGFHTGVVIEYAMAHSFGIQPELSYVFNGASYEGSDILGKSVEKGHITMHQLQLPVNLKYWLGTENVKIFITAGPYIGFGLLAESKIDGIICTTNLYGDNAILKRFDFGIVAGLGFEVNKFVINAGYQFGIANLSNVSNVKQHMGSLIFGIGCFF